MGTKQGSGQQDQEPEPSKWDRTAASLVGVADRSTGWVAARVKDTFQDFVGRVLYGETGTPEPSDKWDQVDRGQEPERADRAEKEPAAKPVEQPEPDKGIDR